MADGTQEQHLYVHELAEKLHVLQESRGNVEPEKLRATADLALELVRLVTDLNERIRFLDKGSRSPQ